MPFDNQYHGNYYIVSRIGSIICLFLLISVIPTVLRAQDRCGTVEYIKSLRDRHSLPENDLQFENWLQNKITQKKNTRTLRQQSSPYKIPVVVHVIHNGEAIGSGTNISKDQILSQIRVMNADFRRQNADATNTPAEFTSVAGSMDIEFVLAKTDPEGLPTEGIVRVKGNRPSWTMNDNYEIKSQSYWPAENYFNIWVCNLTDFLGYAQFPVSPLIGLENSSTNRLTDGVVIWYRAFGSVEDGNFNLDPDYDRGRTVTHEVSHFFGLRHIWGDDDGTCSGSDYVSDTPNQSGSSSGCPTYPKVTCDVSAMFQNFLDYTDDACMNLFTKDQVNRMSVVIENSPRRETLLTSPGLVAPSPVANDLGIRKIISPLSSSCGTNITPSIEIRNYGSNTVTSARIRYKVNGLVMETKDLTLNLGYLASTTVTFSPITLTPGSVLVIFEIILTNGVADAKTWDNTATETVTIPESIVIPFVENFSTPPDNWAIQNPDQQITWQLATAPNSNPSNQALMMNFYDYEDNFGEVDVFLSPVFDLSNTTVASLMFDVAYARYQGSNDKLRVYAITDCSPVMDGQLIFDKSGALLATVPSSSSVFTPKDEDDWRRELINISQFAGSSKVQLAFVGINDWGNRLYLDNITLVNTEWLDASLAKVISPSLVTCDKAPSPTLLVENLGSIPITSITVEYAVNSGKTITESIQDLNIPALGTALIALPAVSLPLEANMLSFNIVKVNGVDDENAMNNSQEVTSIVNEFSEKIPWRENFEGKIDDQWIFTSPQEGMNWQVIKTNYQQSLYFNSFNNPVVGEKAWAVSPVLDFTRWKEASMVFDLSYRSRSGKREDLKIMGSWDCGNSYHELHVNLPKQDTTASWMPQQQEHWLNNIPVDLSGFGHQSKVRIAFVVTNANGNNLYIDNIEFFTTEQPDELEIETPYTIYGYNLDAIPESNLKIKFNLPERQDVKCYIIDPLGRTISAVIWYDVLNQTYDIDPQHTPVPGVYFVKFNIAGKLYASRVLIGR